MNEPRISVVMATYNRRQLLINTLKTIEYYNSKRNIEVIVVDDASDKEESITNIPKLFKIPVIIIPIKLKDKNWTCECVPFNIGFGFITGDIVIIQNPENLHVGDIVGYAMNNIRNGIFLSFALYSMNQADTDNLYKNAIAKGLYSNAEIKKVIGKFVGKLDKWTDGDTCWYNHSVFQPAGHHLISAITRNDLEDLNGFDERYSQGFAYTDFDLRERMKRKGMITRIIDDPFAIHQRHKLSDYVKMKKEFQRNGEIFTNITLKEKNYRSPNNSFYSPREVQKKSPVEKIVKCPISKSSESVNFLDLGEVPLVNNLCNTREQSLACEKFPLAIQLFKKSRLTCLTDIVNKDELFLTYTYQSGVNKPFLDHCLEMYDYLHEGIGFEKGNTVIDIGGNDGSLLLKFRERNPDLKYINIDASQSFIEINKQAGIEYINKFFDENFEFPEGADFIISTNVFQHTFPIRSFVKGVYKILKDNGIWCLEFPYLLTTLLNDNYDQIYHEHVYYYLLQNIVELLSQEGLKVLNVSFFDIHSGTLRVISVKESDPRIPDYSINSFLNLEKLLTDEYYIQWGERTHIKIKKFKEFIEDLYNKKAKIACFGAAAKGCVFLNTCNLDYKKLMYIIDDTPFKQGKFVPGTGLEIVSREVLKKDKIDYMIILAHNFKDYIIQSLKGQYKGKFVIMFPSIKII